MPGKLLVLLNFFPMCIFNLLLDFFALSVFIYGIDDKVRISFFLRISAEKFCGVQLVQNFTHMEFFDLRV